MDTHTCLSRRPEQPWRLRCPRSPGVALSHHAAKSRPCCSSSRFPRSKGGQGPTILRWVKLLAPTPGSARRLGGAGRQPGALRLGRPQGRSVRFAAASWEPWTLRAVATHTSEALGAEATRRASVGGTVGGCFGGARDGPTDGGPRARRRAGAAGLKFEKRWRGAGGKAAELSCAEQSCAPPGGRGEAGGMAEHAAGTERREPGNRGGRPAAARSRLDALCATSTLEPGSLPPAPRTYFPAQVEAVVAPGTRDIRAEGSPLRHRSKLAEVRQPGRCPPLPPHPPPPPKRLSHHPGGGGSSPLPRAHSAAAAAGVHAHSAPEPSRLLGGRRPAASPPARPVPAPGNVSTLPSPDRLRARPIGRKERAGPPHWPSPHIERANRSRGFRSPWRPMLLRAKGPGEGGE